MMHAVHHIIQKRSQKHQRLNFHTKPVFVNPNFKGAQQELIPPAYVAWRAGTTTLFLIGSEPSQNVLKFQHSTLNLYRVVPLRFSKVGPSGRILILLFFIFLPFLTPVSICQVSSFLSLFFLCPRK